MSLINSRMDMTPFDLKEKPVRQFLPISMLLWTVSYISTGGPKMKIRKIRMRGLKGPYLVLATHQGPMDYYIVPRLLFPRRANYVSDMEGFANYGKWLYRHGGCIGKRRYTPSVEALLNMKYVLEELREPLVIFPESRHCDSACEIFKSTGRHGDCARRLSFESVLGRITDAESSSICHDRADFYNGGA